LLKIVQSLVQLANLVDFLFKSRELHDEDVLVNFVVQKRRFDVHLLDFSIIDDEYDVHCFIIHWFNYRDKRFRVIESFDLFKFSNHSACFVAQNLVVFFSFDLVDLFVAKYSSIFEKIDECSDFVDLKKIIFVFHDLYSFFSTWIVHCFFVWSRLQDLLKIDDAFHASHNQQI
jgi:hypothetical protein